MSSRSLSLTLAGALTLASGAALAKNDGRALRFLAGALTDRPPSVALAKDLAARKLTLEEARAQLLASPSHRDRIWRYFDDMFGVGTDIFVTNQFSTIARQEEGGPYTFFDDTIAAGSASCDPSETITTTAWWLESGETIEVCPVVVAEGPFCVTALYFQPEAFAYGSCGCGPELVGCYPYELTDLVLQYVQHEFAERAVHAYENGWSWFDLLGGPTFFTNRILYHHYLYSQRFLVSSEVEPEELATLLSLPLRGFTEAAYPAGPERAGLVTSAGFLNQFNNFRPRIRALTERLLCGEIGPELNVAGLTSFINPDTDAQTLSHADRPDCQGCHFGMDNLGSTLLGWEVDGTYIFKPSQLGMVFGQEVTGPTALVQGYLERGPGMGFARCMAKTAWEDFTGEPWARLKQPDQAALVAAAQSGPQELFTAMFDSKPFLEVRR